VYLIDLFDIYGELLTDKQITYFKDYYFDDLSLSEMSENYNISRNAVHKQIKDAVSKLNNYEGKLRFYQKKLKICDIISRVDDRELVDEIKEII
jgi:Uncharacterized protein conserved in bacteria